MKWPRWTFFLAKIQRKKSNLQAINVQSTSLYTLRKNPQCKYSNNNIFTIPWYSDFLNHLKLQKEREDLWISVWFSLVSGFVNDDFTLLSLQVLFFKALSANPTKKSNTIKQFVGCYRRIVWVCLTILWGCRLKS